jgi:hypothetical protein
MSPAFCDARRRFSPIRSPDLAALRLKLATGEMRPVTGCPTTGALGAAVLAPHLSDISGSEVYVEATTQPELLQAARLADVEPIDGGRLLLRPYPTATSRWLATEAGGLRVAPWPRVYADLRVLGVRGEEAAEHVREAIDGR